MDVVCTYNERADVSQVAQHVAIDLAECMKNSVVPSQVNSEDLQYGNITEVSQIAGKPSDVFEAMQLNRSFAESLKDKKEKAE